MTTTTAPACPLCGGVSYSYDLRDTDHHICTVECGSCDFTSSGPTPEEAEDNWIKGIPENP